MMSVVSHHHRTESAMSVDYLAFRNEQEALLAEPGAARHVDAAIVSRRSIRAFLPTPVPRATIEDILRVARHAPSGTNLQPWKVYVMTGALRQKLTDTVLAICADPEEAKKHIEEVRYYPEKFFPPYIERRRAVGWGLYGRLGITREDRAGMRAQGQRNYKFFDAPVGMICTIHRDLETGSWLDYGMFLQNIMIAARARGLDTCAQAAWTDFHGPVREVLGIGQEEIIIAGMALGYADHGKVENGLATARVELDEFVTFMD